MGVSILCHIPFTVRVSTNYDIVTNEPEAKHLLLFERHVYVKIFSLSARAFQKFLYFRDG
jgi:hypothetical protein